MAAAPTPRKRRRALIVAPFAVALLLLAGMAAAWIVLRGRVAAALAAAPATARAAGVELRLGSPRIDGFPFRLRVTAGPVRVATASGWAAEAPALVAQALTYNPLHWVLIAPDGLTVVRPLGGPVRVTGAGLRASVAGVRERPWRVSLVGEEVRFATPQGARPFTLASARRIGLYLKPAAGAAGAAGDGAVLLDLAGARATPGGLAWNLAPDAGIDAAVEGRLTRLAAFSGRDWGAAARAWRDAGGALALGHVEALGGATELWAAGGRFTLDAQGRLTGGAPLRMRQAPVLIAGPAGAQTITVQPLPRADRDTQGSRFPLELKDGVVRLGPMVVGPAPKVG